MGDSRELRSHAKWPSDWSPGLNIGANRAGPRPGPIPGLSGAMFGRKINDIRVENQRFPIRVVAPVKGVPYCGHAEPTAPDSVSPNGLAEVNQKSGALYSRDPLH